MFSTVVVRELFRVTFQQFFPPLGLHQLFAGSPPTHTYTHAIPYSMSPSHVPRYIACIPAPLFLLRPQFICTPPQYVLLPLSRANGRNYISCFSLLKGWADTVKNSSNSNKMQVNRIHPRLTWLQTKFMTLWLLRNIDPSTAGDLPWHEVVTCNKTVRDLCMITKLHLTLLP